MKRSLPSIIALLLLSGCASTGSNYYNYEGSGDYYYGATAADVVISPSPYGYGWAGSSYGYGFGGGYGYGYGLGYGYGGGYGWPYSYWNYAYRPHWSGPSHQDSGSLRGARVEQDRATRAGLIRRNTVQAPDSAKWQHVRPASRSPYLGASVRRNGSSNSQSTPRIAPARPARRSSAPSRSQTMRSSPPPMTRSAPPPAPVRSAPPPRPSTRRD